MATNSIEEAFINAFRPLGLNGTRELIPTREAAEASLQNLKLPGRKTESWKYTSLRPILKREYRPISAAAISSIDAYRIPDLVSDVLVFVNGEYSKELSDISHNQDVLEISALSSLSAENKEAFQQKMGTAIGENSDIFSALNTAYAKEGTLLLVPAGKTSVAPIHLIHLTVPEATATISQSRNLFVVEKNASAQLISSHFTVGEGESLSNTVTEMLVSDNARLEVIQFQLESDQASRIDRIDIQQQRDSYCSVYTFTMSGDIVRNNIRLNLEGQHTESHLIGAYLLSDSQHVDNYTEVHHKEPNCFSNELYKGIIGDQATGVFSGKIHVYEDAQKTNAYQTNRNIVLSNSANIYTKPQLEIYADDVKCSHGATTGRLDEEAMFYLRARGIKEGDARIMLIYAFCMEVAENISIEPIKEYVSQLIQNRY
ncbi:MAG: Fe-S cluster assembly protein SufD [Bacteroidota bacterium]